MSWDLILDKHATKYERTYVSCHEPYEREYIIDLIVQHFPKLQRIKITEAIELACKTIATPRNRQTFLKFVERHLNGTLSGR